jgi:hypothetical protein
VTTVRLCFAPTSTKEQIKEEHMDVSAKYEVKEPAAETEFEVQAYLWNELRKLGVNARGEVKTQYAKRSWVRFDVAIFDAGGLAHIIEVKRSPINHKTTWEDTRQGKRYNEFGVPVTIIYGMKHAEEFIKTKGEAHADSRND